MDVHNKMIDRNKIHNKSKIMLEKSENNWPIKKNKIWQSSLCERSQKIELKDGKK